MCDTDVGIWVFVEDAGDVPAPGLSSYCVDSFYSHDKVRRQWVLRMSTCSGGSSRAEKLGDSTRVFQQRVEQAKVQCRMSGSRACFSCPVRQVQGVCLEGCMLQGSVSGS